MALITCPECEKQISSQTKSCPNCGYPIKKRIIEWDITTEDEKPKDKVHEVGKAQEYLILGGLLIVFILIFAVIFNKGESKTISTDTGIQSQVDNSFDVINTKYAKSTLNIREKPIADSKVLKTLEPNEKVKTKGIEENGFVQILNSENQIYGWCLNKYLQDKPLRKKEFEEVSSNNLGYSIIGKNNISLNDFKGMNYKIQLNEKTIPNEDEIKKICNTIWENGNKQWEEFYVYVYLSKMKTNGSAYCVLDYSNKGYQDISYTANNEWIEGSHTKEGSSIDQTIDKENKARTYSSSSNEYVVKEDVIFAATSKSNLDLMMNCFDSKDLQALQLMIINGQLISLSKNDVVFLVKPTFSYYIIRQKGSTQLLYVIGEQLQKR